jgi:hypothetical protein
MKYLFSVLLLLSAAACAVASTTTISASNITDLNGRKIAAARLCFQPVDASGIAIGYRDSSAQVVPVKKCGLVSNGALQSGFAVFDSLTTVPTNVRYHITLTSALNTSSVIRDFGTTTITGTTWTLDTFDPGALVLPALFTASSTSGSLAVNGDFSVSGTSTLSNTTINGNLSFTGTLTGTVPVSTLSSSVSTVNGVSCALAGSCTITAANPFALTLTDGAGAGTAFNGSAARAIGYLSTTQTATQTILSPIHIVGGAKTIIEDTNGNDIALYVMSPYAATGGYTGGINFGKAASMYNSGSLIFNYNASASTVNYVGIGLFGADNMLNIFGSGNVAIGTQTDAGYKLYVAGTSFFAGHSFFANYASIGIGHSLGYNNDSDVFTYDGNTVGHYSLGWYYDSAIASGPVAHLSGYAGLKFFTYGILRMYVALNGYVGIGTDSPSYTLQVNGGVAGISWTATSDARDKHNIHTLDPKSALDKVLATRAVQFAWNDPKQDQGVQTGWIAQEVESHGMASSVDSKPGKVYAEDGSAKDVDDARMLKQNEMTAYLWAAVQEQQRQINQLRKQIKRKGAR